MIMSSHSWDFACGGADLALSLNKELLLSKYIRDVMNTDIYTCLEPT